MILKFCTCYGASINTIINAELERLGQNRQIDQKEWFGIVTFQHCAVQVCFHCLFWLEADVAFRLSDHRWEAWKRVQINLNYASGLAKRMVGETKKISEKVPLSSPRSSRCLSCLAPPPRGSGGRGRRSKAQSKEAQPRARRGQHG